MPKKFPQPTNRYDDFVLMHMMSYDVEEDSMIVHQSSAFLPWHRAYLRMLERDLQKIKPKYKNVTIPYRDWTSVDSTKAMWSADFMGGNGRESDGRIMDGRFAYDSGQWKLYTAPEFNPIYTRPDLCRWFGRYIVNGNSSEIHLPNSDHVLYALKIKTYDRPEWNNTSSNSFRNTLEGYEGPGRIHNIVHVWVGGVELKDDMIIPSGTRTMVTGQSPNDPAFFIHHANIDRLWSDWQLGEDNWKLDYKGYLPITNGPVGKNATDSMTPWNGITLARVANFYKIDSKGYKYNKYYRDNIKIKNLLLT